jgi:hypothetical protein
MGLMDKWTDGDRDAPEPLEGNVVATITTGTVVWFVLLVAQLPFYDWYAAHDRTWFLWTCAAGTGLGLIGIGMVRRRERGLRAAAAREAAREAEPSPDGDEDGDG